VSAYVVSIRLATKNLDELARYAQKAPASGAAAGRTMKRLATSSGRIRSLIGGAPDGVSILEFATFEEAEAWFDSPEYQEAVRHLCQGADYQMFIVEGQTEIFGAWPGARSS
jgi:uncharacterized protein (DUF1330 family)